MQFATNRCSVEGSGFILLQEPDSTDFNSNFVFIHACPLVHLCTHLLTLFCPWPS